jgi:glyoxalase family protein
MNAKILGIHHVTAIAGDPQANVDFYTGSLGLRLVKKTVNFDDPGTYHLYFGDETGRPGTLMTFFPWRGVRPGRHGTGQATVTSFLVPEGSLGWWEERLEATGVEVRGTASRFAEEALELTDPDGLQLELVARPEAAELPARSSGPVPEEYAIRGFHGVTLCLEGYESTAELLVHRLGFVPAGEERSRFRFHAGEAGPGQVVDLECSPDAPSGIVAGGTVHHVAFRVESDAYQRATREILLAAGMNVTPVLDRNYFRSIYFREPGGVLFEVATDPPGFTVDESTEELGRSLKLPEWLEPQRERIERALPELRVET